MTAVRIGSREEKIGSQRERMNNNLSVLDLLVYGRYLTKLKRDHITGSEMLKVLRKTEDQKRGELVEASKEKRVYEKLKEKRRDHFNKEYRAVESKENDETAIVTYRRSRS